MEKLDLALSVLPWLITAFSFFKAWRSGKSWKEALDIAVDTLKVEDKMTNGTIFKPELIEKVDKVAEAIEATKDARDKVKEVLKKVK